MFHEIYSAYYQTIAKILTRVQEGEYSPEELEQIVTQTAFGESTLTILPSLQKEKWQLLTSDRRTPVIHPPTTPMTLLQKQWLKALTLDPRFRLFGLELPGLEEVEPLFTPEDFLLYDQYGDGDPYEEEGYIARFRVILQSIREKRPIHLQIYNRKGNPFWIRGYVKHLEYSEKDDKFRLFLTDRRNDNIINLARIRQCKLLPPGAVPFYRERRKGQLELILRIREERNTLERCLLHFAHFKKRVEQIDRLRYELHLFYDREDETEILIRILGFGPFVEVLEPESLREQIIERLKLQKSCEL